MTAYSGFMESTTPLTDDSPARFSGRVLGLDLARALAIFGMFYAHVGVGIEDGQFGQLLTSIPDGRSSILFALLAGVSFSILTGRNIPYIGEEARTARLRIFGRSCMLLVIAGVLAIFNKMVILILASYAGWFVAALPFARWSAKKLFVTAAVLGTVGPTVGIFLNWFFLNLGYWGGDANAFTIEVFITGTYWGALYMAVMLVGMGIGRLDLAWPLLHARLMAIGTILAVVGYGSSWALSTFVFPADTSADLYSSEVADSAPAEWPTEEPTLSPWIDDLWMGEPLPPIQTFITAEPHSGTSFEAIGSGGFALIILGLCLAIGHRMERSRILRTALFPLTASGSMALTAYSVHIVVLGLRSDWVMSPSWQPIMWLVGVTLVLCTAWKLLYRRGPLEWVMWKVSLRAASVPEE